MLLHPLTRKSVMSYTFSRVRYSLLLFTLPLYCATNQEGRLQIPLDKGVPQEESALIIHEGGFYAPQKLGVLKILKDHGGYSLLTTSGIHRAHNHDVNTVLKKMSTKQLTSFLEERHGVIKVSQFDNGEFKLDAHTYGKGGGPIGATVGVVAGTVLVQGVAHGAIWTLAAMTGPFVYVVGNGLEALLGPTISTATVYGATIGGLAGAAATGPI